MSRSLPYVLLEEFVVSDLAFRSFSDFEVNFCVYIWTWVQIYSFVHENPSLHRYVYIFLVLLSKFHFFLGPPVCCISLHLCFYVSTIQFWLLYFCNIILNHGTSNFVSLSMVLAVKFCGSMWIWGFVFFFMNIKIGILIDCTKIALYCFHLTQEHTLSLHCVFSFSSVLAFNIWIFKFFG